VLVAGVGFEPTTFRL